MKISEDAVSVFQLNVRRDAYGIFKGLRCDGALHNNIHYNQLQYFYMYVYIMSVNEKK